jgi:arylsulfatase A
MKTQFSILVTISWLSAGHIALADDRPNIVFMLSDDQAWYGLSVQMHPDMPNSRSDFYHTPYLEELASQGMRFSAAYSPATVCSPTRASLQNGKSPAQNNWTKAAPIFTAEDGYKLIPPPQPDKNLPASDVTIGELLQQAGYMTAHYGKWHIDGSGPERHGYHEGDGNTANGDANPLNDPENPLDVIGSTERALEFMRKSNEAGKPFFVQMSYYPLHQPQNASQATVERVQSRTPGRMHSNVARAAVTEDLDKGVGVMMEGLDRLGLAGNTYLIYMGDNGAGGRGEVPLAGGKGSVLEGGIRAPFIIRGPGIDENSFSSVAMVGYDLYPTFAEWAGVEELPNDIEGGSIANMLSNGGRGSIERPREELVFHFPHYQQRYAPQSAVMLGNLKLVRYYASGEDQLFDIVKDIGETQDLAARMPGEAQRMGEILDTYLASIGAKLPEPNPLYDPATAPTTAGGGMGEGMGGGMGGMGGIAPR